MTDFLSWNRRSVMASLGVAAALPQATRAGVPATVAQPLSAYACLPAYEHVCLSPDGSRVAFVAGSNAGRAVCDENLTTNTVAGKSVGKDPVTFLMWADNTHILVVTSPGRPEGPFLAKLTLGGVINVESRKQMQIMVPGLIHPHETNNFQRVQIGGKNRLTVPDYDHGDTQSRIDGAGLSSYSLDSGRLFDMDVDGQPIVNWVVRPDGTIVGRSEYDYRTGLWKLRYKSDKGWQEIFHFTELTDVPVLLGLGRDGQSLLVKFNSGENADHYMEIDPQGVPGAPFDLGGTDYYPLFNQQTYALAGFASSRPIESCVFYDPRMNNLPSLLAKALPNARNYLVDYGEDPRSLIVYSEGDDDAGTYYYINFLSGKSSEIGAPYPNLSPTDIGKQSQFSYKAQDGLQISAFLTLPPTGKSTGLPVVVLPHGGLGGYDTEGFDWLAQAIASRGYAVVQPNFRGSGGNGHDFLFAGHGEIAGRTLSDLSDAVEFLAKAGTINPNRAAIVGSDFAGFMALASVTVRQGNYRCAAAVGGISDVKAFLDYSRQDYGFNDSAPGLVYMKRYFGDDTQWPDISPINHASQAACPILLIHGLFDAFILPNQSKAMHDALIKAGKVSDYLPLKNEDSTLYGNDTRLQAVAAIIAFLDKHNPAG